MGKGGQEGDKVAWRLQYSGFYAKGNGFTVDHDWLREHKIGLGAQRAQPSAATTSSHCIWYFLLSGQFLNS